MHFLTGLSCGDPSLSVLGKSSSALPKVIILNGFRHADSLALQSLPLFRSTSFPCFLLLMVYSTLPGQHGTQSAGARSFRSGRFLNLVSRARVRLLANGGAGNSSALLLPSELFYLRFARYAGTNYLSFTGWAQLRWPLRVYFLYPPRLPTRHLSLWVLRLLCELATC